MAKISLIRSLEYAGKAFLGTGLPFQFIYFVTSRCASKCEHCCNQTQSSRREANELSLDEVRKIIPCLGNILSLSLTGGDPFLRDDIVDIAEAFCSSGKVDVLSTFPSALFPDRAVSLSEEMLSRCQNTGFILIVSFDGMKDTHDKIRGVPGAFDKAVETIHLLKKLKSKFNNFEISTITTCSQSNQSEILKLYDFIDKELNPDSIGLNFVRTNKPAEFVEGIDVSIYEEFANKTVERIKRKLKNAGFSKRLMFQRSVLGYEEMVDLYKNRKFQTYCNAGRSMSIMYEDGNIYPCEPLSMKIGNIRDFNYDFAKLWASDKAKEVRKYIKKAKCFCSYECAMSSNFMSSPKYLLELINRSLRNK